jgi:hypothetical protein
MSGDKFASGIRGGNISIQRRFIMNYLSFVLKHLFRFIAVAVVALKGATAAAGELPTFELAGFPISAHRVSVIGSANVQAASQLATTAVREIAASPHQVAGHPGDTPPHQCANRHRR